MFANTKLIHLITGENRRHGGQSQERLPVADRLRVRRSQQRESVPAAQEISASNS